MQQVWVVPRMQVWGLRQKHWFLVMMQQTVGSLSANLQQTPSDSMQQSEHWLEQPKHSGQVVKRLEMQQQLPLQIKIEVSL
jgi:hypothetical protein